MGSGSGGGGSSAGMGTSSCGRDEEDEEEADYAACTQESQVVDLLSDSDEDEGTTLLRIMCKGASGNLVVRS